MYVYICDGNQQVEEGHNECLEVLVAAGADLHAKSKDGYTPLHEAARFGFVFTAQLLLESNGLRSFRTNKNI
jgi:ankyrin repeat protein